MDSDEVELGGGVDSGALDGDGGSIGVLPILKTCADFLHIIGWLE